MHATIVFLCAGLAPLLVAVFSPFARSGEDAAAFEAMMEASKAYETMEGEPEELLKEAWRAVEGDNGVGAFILCRRVDKKLAERDDPEARLLSGEALGLMARISARRGGGETSAKLYVRAVERFGSPEDAEARQQIAALMFDQGQFYNMMGDAPEAIGIFGNLVKRFGDDLEGPIQEYVAKALVSRGILFGESGNPADEAADYAEVERRYGGRTEFVFRDAVARAMFCTCIMYFENGEFDRGAAACERLFEKFRNDLDDRCRVEALLALTHLAQQHRISGNKVVAVTGFQRAIHEFGEETEDAFVYELTDAYNRMAMTRVDLGESDQALATWDEALAKYGDSQMPELKGLIAEILFNKGGAFMTNQDFGAAIPVYEDLLLRFGESADPEIREVLRLTRNRLREARTVIGKGDGER